MREELRTNIIEYARELHSRIYAFEDRVSAQFRDLQAPNLAGILEEVTTLRTKVHSLAKI